MEATEDVLRLPERGDVGDEASTSHFHGQFGRISQLLESNPDVMKAFGRVQSVGDVNRRSDAGGTTSEPRVQCPQPCALLHRRTGAGVGIVSLAHPGGAPKPVREPLQLRGRKFRREAFARLVSGVPDGCPDQAQRCRWVPPVLLEFLDQHHQDVQFAHDPQPLRHPSETSLESAIRIVVQIQEGKQFAKPPRRDTRVVQGLQVALADAGQLALEGIEPLLKWTEHG